MKNIGIVSYNINVNFTNYGSALQSWAMSQIVDKFGVSMGIQSKLIDYCPIAMKDCDILHPFKRMWDTDDESRRMVEKTMPAIKVNYKKFEDFYTNHFRRTKKKYHDNDFDEVVVDENIEGFICGSDTIFCINEFNGFVEGYFANFDCMRGKSISYAASFGDSTFTPQDYLTLNERLKNFKAIGIREIGMLDYVRGHCNVRADKVLDPTLLAEASCYDKIIAEPQMEEKYLLYYSRRYNTKMEQFAERLAKERGLKFVEISIRATNAEKGHIMRYDAGVEEFLSLVKNAECVVTNSFHGVIFAVQMKTPFYCFSREQGDTKIGDILDLFGLKNRIMVDGTEFVPDVIDYDIVHERIAEARKDSEKFLKYALVLLLNEN
jgi:hypothetical protein